MSNVKTGSNVKVIMHAVPRTDQVGCMVRYRTFNEGTIIPYTVLSTPILNTDAGPVTEYGQPKGENVYCNHFYELQLLMIYGDLMLKFRSDIWYA